MNTHSPNISPFHWQQWAVHWIGPQWLMGETFPFKLEPHSWRSACKDQESKEEHHTNACLHSEIELTGIGMCLLRLTNSTFILFLHCQYVAWVVTFYNARLKIVFYILPRWAYLSVFSGKHKKLGSGMRISVDFKWLSWGTWYLKWGRSVSRSAAPCVLLGSCWLLAWCLFMRRRMFLGSTGYKYLALSVQKENIVGTMSSFVRGRIRTNFLREITIKCSLWTVSLKILGSQMLLQREGWMPIGRNMNPFIKPEKSFCQAGYRYTN